MDKKILQLLEDIEKIRITLISNLNSNSLNSQEINERIIDLSSKYKDQDLNDLLKFIVYMNDNLNNLNNNTSEAFLEALDKLLDKKKELIEIIRHQKIQVTPKNKNNFNEFVKSIGWQHSIITIGFIGMLIVIFLFFHPEKTETIVNGGVAITKNIKGKK